MHPETTISLVLWKTNKVVQNNRNVSNFLPLQRKIVKGELSIVQTVIIIMFYSCTTTPRRKLCLDSLDDSLQSPTESTDSGMHV